MVETIVFATNICQEWGEQIITSLSSDSTTYAFRLYSIEENTWQFPNTWCKVNNHHKKQIQESWSKSKNGWWNPSKNTDIMFHPNMILLDLLMSRTLPSGRCIKTLDAQFLFYAKFSHATAGVQQHVTMFENCYHVHHVQHPKGSWVIPTANHAFLHREIPAKWPYFVWENPKKFTVLITSILGEILAWIVISHTLEKFMHKFAVLWSL